MANAEPEGVSTLVLKLVDIAERQLDSFLGFQQAMREYMAHTDAKFAQTADMFVQLGGWVRGQGDEIVRTNERLAATNERLAETEERIERLERRIEQLLRALLRSRGDGEGAEQG